MIQLPLQLPTYNAAYSNMPMILESDNIFLNQFNYLIRICYNAKEILNMETYSYLSNVYTKLTFINHNFKLGDSLLIFTGQYKGEYIVTKIIDNDTLVINLTLDIPFVYDGLTYICNFIPYKKPINPDGQANVDISNTIKDFVKSTIEDTNDIIDGSSTRFEFFIVAGEEYYYEFEFQDNVFVGGNVGFVNTNIIDVNDVKLQIGDKIQIQQNTYVWDYDDNYADGTLVGFTSTNTHSFQPGDDIVITGQITNPEYNGPTKIFSIPDPYSIAVYKPFLSNSPAEPGSIYASIPHEYNITTTILDIYYEPSLNGVVIKTDITFARSTSPIGGIIKPINTFAIKDFNYVDNMISYAYDMRFDRLDYIDYNGYNKNIVTDNYILKNNTKLISTIANNGNFTSTNFINYNRIEFNTKSFLLVHTDTNTTSIELGFKYDFYTSEENVKSNTIYGTTLLYVNNETRSDLYFPIGIKQLINNTTTIDVGSFDLETQYKNIKYYTVTCYDVESGIDISKPIYYKINKDCNSGLPTYHLMWKDALGSWLSYPFKYKAIESTEVSRSNYYKREGSFKNNKFSLPTIDRGDSTFYVKSRNLISLTSGWVEEYENKLFSDLIKSSEVYLQSPDIKTVVESDGEFLVDEFNNYITDEFGDKIIVGSAAYLEYITKIGSLIPVVIENTDLTYGTKMGDSIFAYELMVKYAFNDYRF